MNHHCHWLIKFYLTIIPLLIFHYINGQTRLNGNTYIARVKYECAKTITGGCTDIGYCLLNFKKDSVEVLHYEISNCITNTNESIKAIINDRQFYKWKITNNDVLIEGFKKYGNFKKVKNTLVGNAIPKISFDQTNIKKLADSLNGKKYKANIGYLCKLFENGGCTIITDCILEFVKDSIQIAYITNVSCSDSSRNSLYERNNPDNEIKKYKWLPNEKSVLVFGYDACNRFELKRDKLLARYWDNVANTEFIEDYQTLEKSKVSSLNTSVNNKITQIGYTTMSGEQGAQESIVISGDSIIYKRFLQGNIIDLINTATPKELWQGLLKECDVTTFKKIRSGQSNLAFDGQDEMFFIITGSNKHYAFNNGYGENFEKQKPLFTMILKQLSEYRNTSNQKHN